MKIKKVHSEIHYWGQLNTIVLPLYYTCLHDHNFHVKMQYSIQQTEQYCSVVLDVAAIVLAETSHILRVYNPSH